MNSPHSISNASYWQYKDDTSYVLKWIEQTAKVCGWKRQQGKQTMTGPSTPGPQTAQSSIGTNTPSDKITGTKVAAVSGRLKGKDRKALKQQATADAAAAIEKEKKDKYERGTIFNASEILSQANLISTCLSKSPSSVSRPPSSVMQALGRAIHLRRKFSDWFETTRPNDHKSNGAHQYFVKVLEKIANLFLQAAGKIAVNSNEVKTGNAVPGASREVKQNRYEFLLEQAVQEDPENEPVPSTKSSGPSRTEDTITSVRKYQMEVKDSQENVFMVFTLFTDLHDIKAKTKSLWTRCYRDGADMVAATLLTAQTLAFVQQLEDRVMSALDPPEYQEGVPDQGGRQNHVQSFRGTYCRLLNTLRDPTDTQAVLRFEKSNHKTGNKGEAVNMNDLTFAFSARRLNKLTGGVNRICCEPLLLQFQHNPQVLLNEEGFKILDRLERDENLCCLFAELTYFKYVSPSQEAYQNLSERAKRFESVRMDPIMGSLQPVLKQQAVNLTGVFAAEIMLDIKELSDAFPAARPSYDATYDKYMSLLGLKADTKSAKPVLMQTYESPLVLDGSNPAWERKAKEIMDKVLSMLPVPNSRLNDQPSEEIRHENRVGCTPAFELYKGLGVPLRHSEEEYIQGGVFDLVLLPTPTEVHFLFDHYPMFCTHREAFMQTLTESAGIEMLNQDRHGVGAMAHLYNASRQLGLGNLQWPALDRLIELHKVALFAGDPPTTPAAMLRCFSHRYWGPTREMSRKEKKKLMNRAVTQMKPSAMTQAFDQHWDTSGRIPSWYTLEANALAAATEKKTTRNKNTPVTKQTFVENMPVIEEYLTKQLRDARLDYLEIDKVTAQFNQSLYEHARGVFEKQANRVLQKEELDIWSGIDFVSEAFEQEVQLHEAMAKRGGDASKMPVQDCDYLQDSINCLASTLRARGIGRESADAAADGEGVNMPISLTRFRLRGSEDLPDLSRLVLVYRCRCCHRKRYA